MKFSFVCLVSFVLSGIAIASTDVATDVTVSPILKKTGEPHYDTGYGLVIFFAEDVFGNRIEADRDNKLLLTEAGEYTIGGESGAGFCFSDSTKLFVNEYLKSVEIKLNIFCE